MKLAPAGDTSQGDIREDRDSAVPHHLEVFARVYEKAYDQQTRKHEDVLESHAMQEGEQICAGGREQYLHAEVRVMDAREKREEWPVSQPSVNERVGLERDKPRRDQDQDQPRNLPRCSHTSKQLLREEEEARKPEDRHDPTGAKAPDYRIDSGDIGDPAQDELPQEKQIVEMEVGSELNRREVER